MRKGKKKSICISSSQLWSPCPISTAKATPSPCSFSRERQRKRGRQEGCWHRSLASWDGKVWKIRQHHPLTSQPARWRRSYTASVTWPVFCPFPLQCGTCCVFLDPGHSQCAASSVITKTGSREELKLINTPSLPSSTLRGKCYFSYVEFQAMIFFPHNLSSLGDYQRN